MAWHCLETRHYLNQCRPYQQMHNSITRAHRVNVQDLPDLCRAQGHKRRSQVTQTIQGGSTFIVCCRVLACLSSFYPGPTCMTKMGFVLADTIIYQFLVSLSPIATPLWENHSLPPHTMCIWLDLYSNTKQADQNIRNTYYFPSKRSTHYERVLKDYNTYYFQRFGPYPKQSA